MLRRRAARPTSPKTKEEYRRTASDPAFMADMGDTTAAFDICVGDALADADAEPSSYHGASDEHIPWEEIVKRSESDPLADGQLHARR